MKNEVEVWEGTHEADNGQAVTDQARGNARPVSQLQGGALDRGRPDQAAPGIEHKGIMDVQKLKTELATDPVTLGYSGQTAQQKADLLNSLTTGRTRNAGVIETWRIFERFVPAGYNTAITDATNGVRNRSLIETLLGMGTLNVNSLNVSSVITTVFGASSETVKNLTGAADAADVTWRGKDLRLETISRATQLGLGFVTAQDVKDAEAA